MNRHEDISVGDLLTEGRRFVLDVGEHHEGDGFRAIIVVEGFPGFFPSGELSNRLDAPPVLWWATDDKNEAQAMAYSHSEQILGLSRKEHEAIILSSIAAQQKAQRVQVKRDPDTGQVWLRNGYDQEIKLEEDDAIDLYQDLARSMNLPFRENCSECEAILNDEDKCEWCDYQ